MNVLVPSSNAYVRFLPAFAYCFNKRWSADQIVDVFCYDEIPGYLPPNFRVLSLGQQGDRPWTDGLRRALEDYPDQLLLLLEDYWLVSPVRRRSLMALWRYAEENEDVPKIDLTGDRLKVPHSPYGVVAGEELVLSDDDAPYRASLQAAIWQRGALWAALSWDADPWQFEKHATVRGNVLGTSRPILDYVNAVAGRGGAGRVRLNVPSDLEKELRGEGLWPV